MLVLIDELKLQILRGAETKKSTRNRGNFFFTFSNSERRIRVVLNQSGAGRELIVKKTVR